MKATRQEITGWLLVVAAALGAVGQVEGQRAREPGTPPVRGVLKAVDVAAQTITVAVSEGRQPAVDKAYSLTQGVEVGLGSGSGTGRRIVAYKQGKLTDLALGVPVTLVLSADEKVETILAEGPIVRGLLKAIDLSQNTVTVSLPPARAVARGERSDPEDKSFAVAAKAEIAVDDGRGRAFSIKEAKLADLAAGSLVIMHLSVDQKQVQGILAEGPSIQGIAKSVDATRNTITLTLPAGRGADAPEEKTYEVAADVVPLLDDGRGRLFSVKEGTLADVPAGAAVYLKLTADQKNVAMLRAEGPSLSGLVKAVDPEKGTVTIATGRGRRDNPEEKTLNVAKDARITIEGAAGKLPDIKVEERGPFAQLRLSLDQKTVQAITIGSGRR